MKQSVKVQPKSQGKRAYVICNGCPENRIDAARAELLLKANGWLLVKYWQEADLILFNTCGRGLNTATHSLNVIKEIQNTKKKNQKLLILLNKLKLNMKLLNLLIYL